MKKEMIAKLLKKELHEKENVGLDQLLDILDAHDLYPDVHIDCEMDEGIDAIIETINVADNAIEVKVANIKTIPMSYLEKPVSEDMFIVLRQLHIPLVHYDINGMKERFFDETDPAERLYLLQSYFYEYYVNNHDSFVKELKEEMPIVNCSIVEK